MDKIKYILYGIFISFIILGILSFILAFINDNNKIYIKNIEGYENITNRMKERINKLNKDNVCKESLINMLYGIDKTHYITDTVLIKDYYYTYFVEGTNIIDYYQEVLDSCSLDNNDSIYATALTAYAYPNEIKNNYYLNHEFHLKDLFNGDSLRKEEQEIKTYTTKYNELLVLDKLLEVLE